MAQINQINGVATSGTTGVNNLFGSGGGGTITQSADPTFSMDASINFNQKIIITNHASYTQGVQYKIVVSRGGTAFLTTITTDSEIIISDTEPTSGDRTVVVTAQEYGDFYASDEVTNTYAKAVTNFRYYRLQGTEVDGTTWTKDSNGWDEFRLFSGAGQTGTSYPENLTSDTSGQANGYYVDSTFTFSASTYAKYKAFDGNLGSWHWTLTASSAAQNFAGFHFDATAFPTPPTVLSWRMKSYNPDSDRMTLYGSNTGAWSGEEVSLDVVDPRQNGLRVMINRG